MSWEWIYVHFMEIMIYLIIVAGLIFALYVAIASFNPKSMWYEGEKIFGGWEKEDAKKAKAEADRRKNKQWWEA